MGASLESQAHVNQCNAKCAKARNLTLTLQKSQNEMQTKNEKKQRAEQEREGGSLQCKLVAALAQERFFYSFLRSCGATSASKKLDLCYATLLTSIEGLKAKERAAVALSTTTMCALIMDKR